MYLNFTMPGMRPKPVVAGIYRLTFDEVWVYYGSASNLWSRFLHWKHNLSNGVYKNYRMAEVCLACSGIKMEIIEVVGEPERLLERENYYLQQNWGNEYLLNRAPQGGGNTGVKMEEWQVAESRERSRKFGRPVGKYTKDGVFVEKYDSVANALRANALSKKTLSLILRYSGRSTHGYVYRKLDNDGNPIQPPPLPKKLSKKRDPLSQATKNLMSEAQQKWRKAPDYHPVHAKPMVKCDADGIVLERYRSFQYLAVVLGKDPRSLNQMLKKGRPGYYKGFFYHPE